MKHNVSPSHAGHLQLAHSSPQHDVTHNGNKGKNQQHKIVLTPQFFYFGRKHLSYQFK